MNTLDNILNKFIKILLIVNIIIMLTIGSFFLQPVYADGYDFSNSVLPVMVMTNSNYTSGLHVREGNYYLSSSGGLAFAFFSSGGIYVASRDSSSSYYRYTALGVQNLLFSDASYNSTYDIYYAQYTTATSDISYVVSFPDLDTAFQTLSDYINNPPSSTSLYEGFRLPAGYAAAIQGSNVSFDLAVDMPEYSSIKQWAYSTQRYGLESSLPSVASFDYDYGTRIIWSVVGDTNLLGEGYHAAASLSQSVGSGYLLLVNPTYYGSTASIMSADMFNGAVTLSNVSGVTSIRLYSLGSYIGSGGITSDITTGGAVHAGSVVSSGGAFFIDNGDGSFMPINSLPDYGDTSVDGSNSGLISKFRAILEGFVESIESLLIAPVSYIQRIIAAGQTFFTWLSGLWAWLPADVSGILTSVLYVLAVVGALKLLWR